MHQEYEYKFIRVELDLGPGIGGEWSGHFDKAYQSEITVMAKSGWRFVQAFAPAVSKMGKSRYMDLIFEKPKVTTPE